MDLETATSIAAERFHHYDRHPTEKDLMGESPAHDYQIALIAQVLAWLLRDAPVFIARNINIYTRRDRMQHPIEPDLAVFAEVQIALSARRRMRSWRLYEPDRPPPRFVLEVASDKTWKRDLEEKPALYSAVGVEEYCLVDPNDPPYIAGGALRLWRRSGAELRPVSAERTGRLWSETLDSWLVQDAGYLRLIDAAGVIRQTAAEAARAETRAARAETRAARAETRAARAETRAAQIQARTAEAQAQAEAARAEAARAKLRALGIDPDAP